MFLTSTEISGIALVVAVLSPVITAIINNRHQLKIRNIDFYEQHRAEVLENYIKSTGAAISSWSANNPTDYGKSYGEVFLYAPKEIWPLIEDIDSKIKNPGFRDSLGPTLAKISKALTYNPPRRNTK